MTVEAAKPTHQKPCIYSYRAVSNLKYEYSYRVNRRAACYSVCLFAFQFKPSIRDIELRLTRQVKAQNREVYILQVFADKVQCSTESNQLIRFDSIALNIISTLLRCNSISIKTVLITVIVVVRLLFIPHCGRQCMLVTKASRIVLYITPCITKIQYF